jgi:RimJ/RimL family protein N-acetyltransferase
VIWPPPAAPLEGTIVRLEPIDPSHREPLAAVSGEPEVFSWMDRRIPEDRVAFDAWFDARLAASQAGDEWCWVTHRADGGEVVGSSSYLAIRPPHDGLEIGWTWLHPSAWRSGANREAKLLMLALAFETLGCMRVEFKTDARNERSRHALAGIGARFEGIFRQHMLIPGAGRRDSAYFSIVDGEWPVIRAALEAGIAAGGTPSHHPRPAEEAAR